MPIDPSIPLGAKLGANPLSGFADTVNTARGLIGMQAAAQQLKANQVISNAYTQATDPTTGQTDFNKLQALATQGGAGAFLPDFMGKIAQQRNQQQTYDKGQIELALTKQSDLRGRIGSLMESPDFGKGDMSSQIIGAMSDGVQAGTIPLEIATQEARNIPKDPQSQAEWIRQHFMNSLSGEAKLHALLPQTQVINTGGQTNIAAINPMTGQAAITGTLQNTMTPETATSPVQLTTPSGTPYVTTRAQFAGQAAAGQQPNAVAYTGRYGAQPAPQSDVPTGGLQTGLSPAEQAKQTAAASTQATESAKAAQGLHDAAADVPIRVNLLNQARDALSGVNTGPGSDWRNTAKSFFNALSPDLAKRIGWGGDVQNYDEFKKIMTNYASSVSGSLGTGSDSRLNAAITGNANPNISNLANEDILVKTIAAEKMRQAQDYAWQNAGLTADKFNQWQSQWNKSVSPDAFVFAEMNADQQKAFLARQQKAGTMNQFKQALYTLTKAGIIQPPGAQ